jgi:hypothetical protein
MANTLLGNYGNCTTFKLCNENDEFTKNLGDGVDKDYRSLMMLTTPPSKS